MLSCVTERPPSEPSRAAPRAASCSLHGHEPGASNEDMLGIDVSKKGKRNHVLLKRDGGQAPSLVNAGQRVRCARGSRYHFHYLVVDERFLSARVTFLGTREYFLGAQDQ